VQARVQTREIELQRRILLEHVRALHLAMTMHDE